MTDDAGAPGPDQRRVALVLVFRNRNPLAVTIASLDFNLAVNSRHVASGSFKPERSIRIEAGNSAEIVVPLNVSAGGLMDGALEALISRNLEYTLGGQTELDTFVGRVTLPYRFEGSNPEIDM
jgi:hypothetical protein